MDGTVAEGFEDLRDVFGEQVDGEPGHGAAFSAYVDGRLVADLWHGEAAPGRPWERTTRCNMMSTAKLVTAAVAASLVDSGELDLDATVASIWPDFGTADKDTITVRQVLSHQSGMPWYEGYADTSTLDRPESFLELKAIYEAIAASTAELPAGEQTSYAPVLYGWLLSAVFERLTGKGLRELTRERITGPLEAEGYVFGVDAQEVDLVADFDADDGFNSDELYALANPNTRAGRGLMLGPEKRLGTAIDTSLNSPFFRRAEQGACGSFSDARSFARLMACLAAGGELDGVRLLSRAVIDEFATETSAGPEQTYGMLLRCGLGWLRSIEDGFHFGPNDETFGHGGFGGGFVFADPVANVGYAFAPNHLVPLFVTDPRNEALMDALYAHL